MAPDQRSELVFTAGAIAVAAALSGDVLFVALSDGLIHRFRVDAMSGTIEVHHDAGFPQPPPGFTSLCVVGASSLLCLFKGQVLVRRVPEGWVELAIPALHSNQAHVCAVSAAPSLPTHVSAVVAMLVRMQGQYSVLLSVLNVPSMVVAQSGALTVHTPVRAESGDAVSLRFLRRNMVSVNVQGRAHLCYQNDASGGPFLLARMVDNYSVVAASHDLFVLAADKTSAMCLASHLQLGHSVTSVYQHTSTVLHVVCLPPLDVSVAADAGGSVVAFDHAAGQVKGTFCFPHGSVISALQRLVTTGGDSILVVAACRADSDGGAHRLVYSDRRIMFLASVKVGGAYTLHQAQSHSPIVWAGRGSCQLLVRPLVAHRDRLVVAADTLVCVYQYDGRSPNPTRLCAIDLQAVTGNDIVSSMSALRNMITLTHVFGFVAVLNFADDGSFSLHAKAQNLFDGACVMLSRDYAVAADATDGLVVYGRTGNRLHLVSPLGVEGIATSLLLVDESGVVFVGTNAGSLLAVRVVPSNHVSDRLLIKLCMTYDWMAQQVDWLAPTSNSALRVVDGDRMRREGVNRRGPHVKTPSRALCKELQWLG